MIDKDCRITSPFARWRAAFLALAVLLSSFLLQTGFAYASGTSVLRDSEIETYLETMSAPIFEAAGIPPRQVDMVLVQNDDLNAFVAGGMNIFIYSGLILKTETPEELIGVIAHETGHIAGGHLVRMRGAMANASKQAILSTVVGVAAAVVTGRGDVGFGIAAGGQSVAQSSVLTHSRTQESSADAAALAYLDGSGISSRGLLRFMEVLEDQELLPASRQSEYIRTHPLTRDRVDYLRDHLENSRLADAAMPQTYVEMHRRMTAKLLGYVSPRVALRRFPEDATGIAQRYGRAVALWRSHEARAALAIMDELLVLEPENPYFHELKAQILFEETDIEAALPSYRRAAELAPEEGLIRMALGHTLLELPRSEDDSAHLEEAIDHLTFTLQQEPDSSLSHRFLAEAYGRLGQDGRMRLHLAEEALLNRDLGLAISQANRAKEALPQGSGDRLRAEDILARAEQLRAE